jgi:hypothetical protein
VGIEIDVRYSRWGIDLEMDVTLLNVWEHKSEGGLEDIFNIAAYKTGLDGADRGEEATNNRIETVYFCTGRFGKGLELFARGFVIEVTKCALKELQVDVESVEGVANFVGDTSGKRLYCSETLIDKGVFFSHTFARDIA